MKLNASSVQIHEGLPYKIHKQVKRWPFTWKGKKFYRVPKRGMSEYAQVDHHKTIEQKLRTHDPIFEESHIQFLCENPEHGEWLLTHLSDTMALLVEQLTL